MKKGSENVRALVTQISEKPKGNGPRRKKNASSG